MDPVLAAEIRSDFDAYLEKAEALKKRILAQHEADGGEQSENFAALKVSTDSAELLYRQLLMAAYFTANYRSCVSRTDDASRDTRVLDRASPQGEAFGRKLLEECRQKREAEEQKKAVQEKKPAVFEFLLSEDEERRPSASKKRARESDIETETLKSDLLARYKSLHGLETTRFKLLSMAAMGIQTKTIKRTELLEEMNAFLTRFGLSPIDKCDSIWRDWFLTDFIGMDTANASYKPIIVQETPWRKQAVYGEAMKHIVEVAARVLSKQ